MDDEEGANKFLIVKFPDEEDSIAIVHSKWMAGEKCLWPNERDPKRLRQLILRGVRPQDNWAVHSCVVLSSFDTYEDARGKLSKAEVTSDLCSDAELGRGRRKKRRMAKDSEGEYSQTSQQGGATDSEADVYVPPRPPTPPTYFDLSSRDVTREQAALYAPQYVPNQVTAASSGSFPFPTSNERNYGFSQSFSPDCGVPQFTRFPGALHRQLRNYSSSPVLSSPCAASLTIPPREENAFRASAASQLFRGDQRASEHEVHTPGAGTQQNRDHAFEKEVLRILHMLKVTQQSHSEQLSTILQRLSSWTGAAEPQHIIEEPFKTLTDFLTFEEALGDSAAKRTQLKRYLKSVGGSNTRERTFRILSHLLDYKVGREYSLFGTKGKRKFSDLTTWKLVCSCLTEGNGASSVDATIKEVEQATMSWLRHAPQADDRQRQKVEAEERNREEI